MTNRKPAMKYNVVMLNYQLPSWWENALEHAEFVVVADGGANQFMNRTKDYIHKCIILGDLDSV